MKLKLRDKILVPTMLAILAGLAVVAWYSYDQAATALENSYRQAQEQLVGSVATQAQAWVFSLPDELSVEEVELLVANYPVDPTEDIQQFALRPYEARAYLLKAVS